MNSKSIIVLFVFTILLALLAIGWSDMPNNRHHTCYAPCTVNFNGKMAEDEFGIDYIGKGPGKGVLKVWKLDRLEMGQK